MIAAARIMEATLVCRLDDLLIGGGTAALVDGDAVAIFRLQQDRLFAISNIDPFSNVSALSRGIVGDIDGVPVVASPIYKQHFRLDDGVCVEDDTVSVASYCVTLLDGDVIVRHLPLSAT